MNALDKCLTNGTQCLEERYNIYLLDPGPASPALTASRIISRASSTLSLEPLTSIASPPAWPLGTLILHPVLERMALI